MKRSTRQFDETFDTNEWQILSPSACAITSIQDGTQTNPVVYQVNSNSTECGTQTDKPDNVEDVDRAVERARDALMIDLKVQELKLKECAASPAGDVAALKTTVAELTTQLAVQQKQIVDLTSALKLHMDGSLDSCQDLTRDAERERQLRMESERRAMQNVKEMVAYECAAFLSAKAELCTYFFVVMRILSHLFLQWILIHFNFNYLFIYLFDVLLLIFLYDLFIDLFIY
jgi:hypothetical protein